MVPLLKSETGIKYSFDIDDGKMYLRAQADVYDMLELNKAALTANNGWSKSRMMRRIASVPTILRLKWLWEEGWDAWNLEHYDMLKRKLRDPEYRHLRTAPGRV